MLDMSVMWEAIRCVGLRGRWWVRKASYLFEFCCYLCWKLAEGCMWDCVWSRRWKIVVACLVQMVDDASLYGFEVLFVGNLYVVLHVVQPNSTPCCWDFIFQYRMPFSQDNRVCSAQRFNCFGVLMAMKILSELSDCKRWLGVISQKTLWVEITCTLQKLQLTLFAPNNISRKRLKLYMHYPLDLSQRSHLLARIWQSKCDEDGRGSGER